MSERYFQMNLPGRDFREYISSRRNREPALSAVKIIANDLMDEASSKMKERAIRTGHISAGLDIDAVTMFFSGMLIHIDRMIWEKSFNLHDLQEDLNARTIGWAEMEITGIVDEDIAIQDEEWHTMIDTAINDKTLSSFFENPELLPNPVRALLTRNPRGFSLMKNRILPKYKQLAQSLYLPSTE